MKGRILIVDDEGSMREFLSILLSREGYEVVSASTGEEAVRIMEPEACDVVITDLSMPGMGGLELLRRSREIAPPPEVILITAYGTAETAVEAMKQGACDYLTKPFRVEELVALVKRGVERRAAVSGPCIPPVDPSPRRYGMVGESPQLIRVLQLIERAAPTPSTVLITGESGTGKELVARAIHERSGLRGPFVPVNCGSIPETLMESELFGHVQGAFTGAVREKPGLFEEADDGTIFLDEIGEIPLPLQAKLLRVLQEGEVRRIGANRAVTVKTRVVCATNRDLEEEVRRGTFREDLYYRINVVRIDLPPLRERKGDIPLLVEEIAGRLCRFRRLPPPVVTPEAMGLLTAYDYPGNVRQLENVVEQALVMDPSRITPETLPPILKGAGDDRTGDLVIPDGFDLDRELEGVERRYILAALRRTGGKKRAAELLGISFRSLRYRLAKLGIDDDAGDE